ncbi:amidohydrolase [Methanolobus halotolerans]|uniref:Amidohydrolase n=1 Tax=Methanolobus halotolerans TaxID=2052935 RepID=A0A4E0Q6A5_9EURY|nr:amidohydrolase [Methanolobus halotolerans]
MNSLDKWIRSLRRQFHREPELSFNEHRTQKEIMYVLEDLGIACKKIAGTGVIAEIHGNGPGPCMAIRSDMDALAVVERATGFNEDYISRNPGVMHACGHDGHMAIVLGAARLLQEQRDSFGGSVRLIFQPAEEVPPGGAVRVIGDGGLEGVDAIVGLHIFGDVDVGAINIRAGPFMAGSVRFTVKIFGKGGHHSTPGDCIDPIAIAADFISSLNTRVSEKVDPSDYALGFGTVNSGEQFNRTPDEVEIVGSFRTFNAEDTEAIKDSMSSLLDYLVTAYSHKDRRGVPSYELKVQYGYPVLFNDPVFTKKATRLLKTRFSNVNDDARAIFGAEDFAYYLQEVPGMYVILGTRNVEKGIVEGNHSSGFDIDEDVLITGVELLYSVTLDFLNVPRAYVRSEHLLNEHHTFFI